MLAACHDRVERMLALQARLQRHLRAKDCDEPAALEAMSEDIMQRQGVSPKS